MFNIVFCLHLMNLKEYFQLQNLIFEEQIFSPISFQYQSLNVLVRVEIYLNKNGLL